MHVKTFDDVDIMMSNDDLLWLMHRARLADILLERLKNTERKIQRLRAELRRNNETFAMRKAGDNAVDPNDEPTDIPPRPGLPEDDE